MFKKKQTPPNTTGRNVQKRTPANVFSYYNSRSTAESDKTRRNEHRASGKTGKSISLSWVVYTPSILAGLVLVFCMFYVSTLGSTPKVRVVGGENSRKIVSDPDAYESEIRTILERSITNRSKVLIDTDKVAREITEEYPELGDIAVILPLVSRQPIVEIRPTDPLLVLVSNNETFVIDENGRAIAYAEDVDSSVRDTLPVVRDESGVPLERGKAALTSETVALVAEVFGQLAASNVPIQSMTLPTVANELHVRLTDKPYYVKFDLRGEGRLQAGALLAVKEHLESQKKTPAEYIDVRVPGKAFYK